MITCAEIRAENVDVPDCCEGCHAILDKGGGIWPPVADDDTANICCVVRQWIIDSGVII